MGIFSRLLFWRRRDENEEGEEGGYGAEEEGPRTEVPPWSRESKYDETGMRRREFQQPRFEEWQQPQQPREFQQQAQAGNAHEIILARLDVINAKLDSLNQRLANLERYAADEEKRAKW